MFRGFLFWSIFRFTLGVLAHFNWLAAFKIKCVYVICWKSFDLLWFWMHLFLCICFDSLRRENFKVIWFNILRKRLTTHRAYTVKEIYMMVYGYGNATQSEVALQRIDTAERKELHDRALRRSVRQQTQKRIQQVVEASSRKKMEISEDSSTDDEVEELLKKGLPKAEEKKGWKAANIRSAIDSKLKDFKTKVESAGLLKKGDDDTEKQDEPGPSRRDDGKDEEKTWSKMKGFVQKVTSPRLKRSVETSKDVDIEDAPEVEDRVYILTSDYSNEFDVVDPRRASKRERKDRRVLRKRVRDRVRRELEEKAEEERRRKLFTDAIDLLLQMLRMVTMFAMVTWNVRKHNPIAAFKHLEIDFDPNVGDEEIRALQEGTVSTYWVLALSITVFLDVSMSFIQFFIAYYQQWQLFKRMGFWRSFLWAAILVSVSLFGMVVPMSFVLESLDLSWCRILPHHEVACWAPPHWVDFPLEDPRLGCNWWMALEGGGHRSPDKYSDWADHSDNGRRRFLLF